jgi:large subunit ribosomal protein L7/L12
MTYTVVLTEVGTKVIEVAREVRAITGLGLKETKDLVEAAPQPVKIRVTKTEANEIKRQLERAGAEVDVVKIN